MCCHGCQARLCAVFLQRLLVVTAFHQTCSVTYSLIGDTIYNDRTCLIFIDACFCQEPLDLVLPIVQHLTCVQPRPSKDRKLLNLLPRPATSGSGAAMDVRHLYAVFLQSLQMVTAFHQTFNTFSCRRHNLCGSHLPGFRQSLVSPRATGLLWALPSVEHLTWWQPCPSKNRKLLKLLLQPATRCLHTVFL